MIIKPVSAKRILEAQEAYQKNKVSSSELAALMISCLLYTSDAADERSSVDLGGRRIIKKKNKVVLE